jgi:hypothetical protein
MWIAAAAVAALTIREALHGKRDEGSDSTIGRLATIARSDPAMTMFDGDSLDSATTNAAAHDPFRLDRHPATIAFSVAPQGVIGPPVPTAPAIRIALQGTIGGPPWHAIISGVPGHEGTVVVSSGDTLGGISIRRVNRDSVTVRIKDSTWTVTLAKAGAS